MDFKTASEKDIELYTWFRLETSLKQYAVDNIQILPNWAKRKGYKTSEELHKVYKERLAYEFGVVSQMGFSGYFLIVSDMIEFCIREGIPIGPARGSGAGALMGILLNITKVDPIRYDLLFERFLNPERYSMPDYDCDISQARRGEVKDYLTRKYGASKVASIGTFSKMKVRAAVKDVVRSLNLGGSTSETFRLSERISKTLDNEDAELTYEEALQNEDFASYIKRFPEVGDHIEKCEGILRQMSMHAAGVLISAEPLDEELPLIVDKNGNTVTAYNGPTVERLGYLKLDTLGLKNLDVIDQCHKNIIATRGSIPYMELEGIDIKPQENPLVVRERIDACEDESVRMASLAYEYVRTGGSTLGIFQCEQSVTQDLLKQAETNSIENIADTIALIRPGPRKAGSTEVYIARKRGEEPISYEYEVDDLPKAVEDLSEEDRKGYIDYLQLRLEAGEISKDQQEKFGEIIKEDEDFLKLAPRLITIKAKLKDPEIKSLDLSSMSVLCDSTQGLPLFQEQIMKMSVRIANFTVAGSDVLRKGVGKKNAKLIAALADMFVKGCIHAHTEDVVHDDITVIKASNTPDLNTEGLSKEVAEYMWYKFILPYGSYGFNLSHSVAYSLVSYETLWLKANFPGEFYAALLSHEKDPGKANEIISEAKAAGIRFLAPDVNKSTDNFTVVDANTIVYSLTCMHGVGPAAVDKIIEARPYKDMVDFLGRCKVNTKTTGILIKGGAFENTFDNIEYSRKTYFDFYKDCKQKLKRQIDRLLRESMIKNHGYIILKGQDKKDAIAAETFETPANFHKRMLEDSEEYLAEYLENEEAYIKKFTYDWDEPVTIGPKATVAVKRMTEDNREKWSNEELFDFEEEIFGAVLSGHRLDPYVLDEQDFQNNARLNGMKVHKTTTDLSIYEKDEQVYVYCMGTRMVNKFPYKKDPKQFTRIFEIEDRYGKIKFSAFDHTFQYIFGLQKFNPLSIMAKKEFKYTPVMIVRFKVNEYNKRRSLVLDKVINWINEDDVKQAFRDDKAKELEK